MGFRPPRVGVNRVDHGNRESGICGLPKLGSTRCFHPGELGPVVRPGVGLRVSGGAAAIADVANHQFREFGDDVRVLVLQVDSLADVCCQVVELNWWQIRRFGRVWSRMAPAARAGAEFELPFALADREGAVVGMVHGRLPERP